MIIKKPSISLYSLELQVWDGPYRSSRIGFNDPVRNGGEVLCNRLPAEEDRPAQHTDWRLGRCLHRVQRPQILRIQHRLPEHQLGGGQRDHVQNGKQLLNKASHLMHF